MLFLGHLVSFFFLPLTVILSIGSLSHTQMITEEKHALKAPCAHTGTSEL